ncbi:MAG: citrate lyase holo-[Clostridia bacterium]|nr:citrate lyase holo-[acyl-carrier protein] synthase [Clostridia bacterium]
MDFFGDTALNNIIGSFGEADVAAMAARREKRAAEQRDMLLRNPGCCLVSITLNIAGPVKRTGLTDRLFFREATEALNAVAEAEFPIRDGLLIEADTGTEALFAVKGDPEKIKAICVGVEERDAAARLADIDVIGPDGDKAARPTPRKCLICGEDARVCARSRAHGVNELQRATAELIRERIAFEAANLAHRALMEEVAVTPKPGLVDRNNSGANPDMDIEMFRASANALSPYFKEMALAVLTAGQGECPLFIDGSRFGEKLAAKLRAVGLEAEKAMLAATGGVNTHRGAIWSIGLMTCAYAYLAASSPKEGGKDPLSGDPELLCAAAARFALLMGDGTLPSSKGSAVRERFKVGGPVEEALLGFPSAREALKKSKEYLDSRSKSGVIVDPWAYGLLAIMARLSDNNALRRGGEEGARFVRERAKTLLGLGLEAPTREFLDALLAFDRELTEKNISCGGAADMLAAAIFLDGAENGPDTRRERFIRSLTEELCEQ